MSSDNAIDSEFDFAILGGGLAGLSVAFNLLTRTREKKVLLLEKEDRIGGLARSYTQGGVTFDFGPHVLRSSDLNLIRWVSDLVQFREHHTNPATVKYGVYFDHVIPTITWSNIERLPRQLSDLAMQEIGGLDDSAALKERTNFEDVLIKRIGKTLYWEFFGQYSAKWWGISPSRLSADLAPARLAVGQRASYAHLTTSFRVPNKEFYPESGGYGSIAEAMLRRINKSYPGRLVTVLNSEVTGFDCKEGNALRILTVGEGSSRVASRIYSSLPITLLSRMLSVRTALEYRSNICVFLTVDKGSSKEVQHSWIYFPEEDVSFSRFCSMGQFSPKNETGDCRGYVAEITCFFADSTWNRADETLVKSVVDDLARLGILLPEAVKESRVVREQFAYPLPLVGYRQERERTLEDIHREAGNVVTIGRTGSFNYWNSDAVLALYRGQI